MLSALSPSQVQYVIHANGTWAAFMDHRREFELAEGGRYMFMYYEDLDGEECDCSRSSHAQDESGPRCYASGSSCGGRQHAYDGEPERERFSSSSNSFYESAVEKQSEGGNHALKHTSCQVLLYPPCYSQGLQAVQETSDAEAQTEELNTSQVA
ncbi:hypothetical protein MTO96_018771 [Rhipicephalus appendiculatus]